MRNFLKQNIFFISVIIGTLALLIGGVFLFSKNSRTSSENKISDSILNPSDSFKTSGIVNGTYQAGLDSPDAVLVEFGDFQCPACGVYHELVKKLLTEMPGKFNFVFRNFPLSQHKNANISSYAAEASGLQGKYWEMHDKLYESQDVWSESSDARSIFEGYAKDIGLNLTQFNKDIDSQKVKDKVQRDLSDGNLIKINSTPSFFLQGIKIENPRSYEEFKKAIEDAIAKNPLTQDTNQEAYHAHFDLKVFLNGSAVNFTLSKYQESESNPLDPDMHFHDGNGKVVHMHKEGVPLKKLFASFNLLIPNGTLAYVNGKRIENILDYVPQDLDQILIGSSNLATVSNDACIYSLKCPERGSPPDEECVGGLGTGCATK
jgi:protein-disulfide isomerase